MSKLQSIMTRFAFKCPDIKPPPIVTSADVRRARMTAMLIGFVVTAREAWNVACEVVAFEIALNQISNGPKRAQARESK